MTKKPQTDTGWEDRFCATTHKEIRKELLQSVLEDVDMARNQASKRGYYENGLDDLRTLIEKRIDDL